MKQGDQLIQQFQRLIAQRNLAYYWYLIYGGWDYQPDYFDWLEYIKANSN